MTSFGNFQLSVGVFESRHPGKGHDRFLIRDNFIGISDGATPLQGERHDAGGFAFAALENLAEAARSVDDWRDAWRTAINRTSGFGAASAAVAAVRHHHDTFQIASLGDCLILVHSQSRGKFRLLDPTVPQLDRAAAGDPSRLQLHRTRRNTVDGYWIFGSEPLAANYMQTAEFEMSDVSSFLLMTDGAVEDLLSSAQTTDDATAIAVNVIR